MAEVRLEAAQLDSKGGYKVQFLRAGTEGPNILFLHPAGQPPLGMTEVIKQLAEVGQVIAPNMFDLISSLRQRGVKNPTFADIVNEFSSFNLINKRERTGIVAASMGGSFAWEYATRNKQEVDWIVGASVTGWPFKRALTEWAFEFAKEFIWEAKTQVPKELQKKDAGPGLFLRQFRKSPLGILHGLSITMNDDSRQQMADIQQPVDLLWGRKDNYVPLWTGEKMAELMVNSRLEVVSEYNHLWVNLEPNKLTSPAIQRVKGSLS